MNHTPTYQEGPTGPSICWIYGPNMYSIERDVGGATLFLMRLDDGSLNVTGYAISQTQRFWDINVDRDEGMRSALKECLASGGYEGGMHGLLAAALRDLSIAKAIVRVWINYHYHRSDHAFDYLER